MSLSLYQASVPVYIHMLESLSGILDKAAAHAEAKKFEPSVLIQSRLAPDMRPFSFQVQTVVDMARNSVARLAGLDVVPRSDKETTFAELKELVTQTVTFLKSVKPEQVDGQEGRAIHLKLGPTMELNFKGYAYLLHFAMPNFYFHVTTAYALLRHNGVDLGKRDFIGQVITG